MEQRGIKFRWWVKHSGRMFGPEDIYWLTDATEPNGRYNPDNVTFMQYTGLKDRNGKEIFEGDLIRNKSGRICRVDWHQFSGAWDATVVNSKGNHLSFITSGWPRHIEVIGNIHENPELLN